jgi:hypothetical protein
VNSQVAKALRELYVDKRTGVLLGEGEEVKRSVMLRAGELVGARSSLIEDRLGEVMIRHGKISRRQFEEAAKHIKSGLKLGEILVELGHIQASDIDEMVRHQLVDILCGLLLTPPARMVFTDMESVDETVAQPISVANVILEATRRSAQVAGRLKVLLALEKPLQLAQDPALRSQEVNLTSEEGFIVSRIDGQETPKSIVKVSPLSETETVRTLLGLMEVGIVEAQDQPPVESDAPPISYAESSRKAEPTPPPPAATGEPVNQAVDARESAKKVIEHLYGQYQTQDHWAVLGVKRGSSREEIDSSFRDKSRLYHPDNYYHIQDRGFQEKLTHVFCRLNEAHQTLTGEAKSKGYEELTKKEQQYEKQNKEWSAPPKEVPREKKPAKEGKGAPAPARDAKEGKAFFAQAKNAFLKCDYWMTIQFCQQAIEIISDQPEYYHLLGMAQKENPKWRQDAERNLKIAIKLDPWKPEYLVALGKVYQDAGMSLRAEKLFEQVRALDPSFPIPG